jgi:hypothetical protein
MDLIPKCLKRACPWCGHPTVVPPAMPLADLRAWVENRCGTCHGGVQAATSWASFALFVVIYAGFSNALVVAIRACWTRLSIGDEQASAALGATIAIAALFLAITFACVWFLVSNSTVQRGVRPMRIRPGPPSS